MREEIYWEEERKRECRMCGEEETWEHVGRMWDVGRKKREELAGSI